MIYRLDPTADERWTNFLDRHPKASIFHTPGWIRALEKTYRYKPIVYTTSCPGEELRNGLVFCLVDSWITGRRLVSLPFSDYCDPLCDSTLDFSRLANELYIQCDREKWKYVELRPAVSCQCGLDAETSFLQGKKFYLHRLDLSPELNVIYEGFDKNNIKRRIQHAERADLVERRGRCEKLLKQFYRLFTITRARHHVPPSPYAWFRNLAQFLGDAFEIRIAYRGNSAAAAILLLRFKDTVYFKYGCSDAQQNHLGATPWLFWRAIQDAKRIGATTFDFGRTEEGNPGLLVFKNHWVPTPQIVVYRRYTNKKTQPSPQESRSLRLAESVFSHLPRIALRLAGQIFYRHIA